MKRKRKGELMDVDEPYEGCTWLRREDRRGSIKGLKDAHRKK